MDRKICLITGANSGIGKEAAILIAQQDYQVIMACRNLEKGKKALEDVKQISTKENVELLVVDMSLQESLRNLSAELHRKYKKIDVVIHNAAIFDITAKERSLTKEGVESVWATNHIGPVLLNKLILDLIKKSDYGRIITISSKGLLAKPGLKINYEDPEFAQHKFSVVKAYYQSKLAQVMYSIWLADELRDSTISVNSIRVPAVQVDVSKFASLSSFMKMLYKFKSRFSLSPVKMAETYLHLATSKDMIGVSGSYFDENNKQVAYSNYQKGFTEIEKLMKLTKIFLK